MTGGAGGLGSATARRLVARRMAVCVFDVDPARAAALAKELGESAAYVGGDVANDADVSGAIGAAQSMGPLSLLVNVAGGGVGGGRTVGRDGSSHGRAAFTTTLEMNAVATFNACRLVAAAMAENIPDDEGQRGVMVNTASIAGYEGQIGQLSYAAGKAAILGMTLPMARDLAPLGIRVCAIAPGIVGTPAMERVSGQVKEHLLKGMVFPKRMGKPEEFALLVEQVASNPYLNGENIRLDGGLRFAPK